MTGTAKVEEAAFCAAELPPGLSVELSGRVLHIVFDRPERKNAVDLQMWQALPGLVHAAEQDDRIRAVAFSGKTADVFSAGADIQEFSTIRSGARNAARYSDAVRDAELAIINCSKPTLALVRGWCVGGGCEIAVACDIRIGETSARMGITPAKLGIVYGQVSTTRLVQETGAPWARFLLLTGEIVTAETAMRSSLLHEVHPPDQVLERWQTLLDRITAGAPITQAGAKALVARAVAGNGVEDAIAESWYQRSYDSEEYRIGVDSFTSKQRPDFSQLPWPGHV